MATPTPKVTNCRENIRRAESLRICTQRDMKYFDRDHNSEGLLVLTTGNEQSGREGQASKQDLCNAFQQTRMGDML